MAEISFTAKCKVKLCKFCNEDFEAMNPAVDYCSDECRTKQRVSQYKKWNMNRILKGITDEAQRQAKIDEHIARKEKRSQSKLRAKESQHKEFASPNKLKGMKIKRECLRCGRSFPSTGTGNRVCPDCNTINSRVSGPREYRVITENRKSMFQ